MSNNIQYISKYQKENTVQVNIRLSKKYDADVIEYLNSLENTGKATVIKRLIQEDMGCESVVDAEDTVAENDEELFAIE